MNKQVQKLTRIGIVTKYFYPYNGGIENSILNTHKYLQNSNFKVNIYTSDLADTAEVKPLPNVFSVCRDRYFFISPIFKIFKNDIVVLQNFNVLPHSLILVITSILKFIGIDRTKIILVPHGGITPNWDNFSFIAKIIKKIYTNVVGVKLVSYTCDRVICVSEWEKLQLCNLGIPENKVVVIPNPIEQKAFETSHTPSKEVVNEVNKFGNYIIQIGKVYPIKNYEFTINALEKINEVSLVIIGPVEDLAYFEKLKEIISNKHLENRVFFISKTLDLNDKYYIISKALLQIHTAKWENFGLAVYEGMSQGLVEIVLNAGNLPFLVKNTVNGYVVNSEIELIDKINYIIQNNNTEIIINIKKLNKGFTETVKEQVLATKLLEVYSRII